MTATRTPHTPRLGLLRLLRLLASLALLGAACGPAAPGGKFPPREEGCAVQVFRDGPKVQSENIGTVSARCDESVSNEDCLRALLDQVCKVGGDVVWGVPEKPTVAEGKKSLSARAAHTAAKASK